MIITLNAIPRRTVTRYTFIYSHPWSIMTLQGLDRGDSKPPPPPLELCLLLSLRNVAPLLAIRHMLSGR